MTLFKTALGNLKNSPVMNIIGLLQLVAVFLAAAVMASTMSIRLRTYEPIKDLLGSNGFHADFDNIYGATKVGGKYYEDAIFSVDELNSYLDADKLVYVRAFEIIAKLGNDGMPQVLCYDNELLSRCKPELKSGRWINENSDELEFVISDNNAYGWKIGDEVELEVPQLRTSRWIKARVVGVIENDCDVFGYRRSRDIADDTYRYLYNTHNSHNADSPDRATVISSAAAVERIFPELETHFISGFFVYGDDKSAEYVKEKARLAGQLNGKVVLDLSTINDNSKVYLRNEMLKQLPVVVVLMILVIVSSVSVSAIAARRRLKDYAKYYVLGLQWKQCAVVNLLQALTTGIAALIISAAVMVIVSFTELSGFITVIFNAGLVLSLLGVLALYLIFSMIMPLLMLRSTTPKELLQTE